MSTPIRMTSPPIGIPIGALAAKAGIEASAIRYYESLGLIPKPARAGGKRRYGPDTIDRLAVIGLAKDAGFTMQEIRQLVAGQARDATPADRWRLLATQKLEELDRTADRLRRMRKVLRRALECGCVDLAACAPILRGQA